MRNERQPDEVKQAARQQVINEYGLSPDRTRDTTPRAEIYNAEWMDGFIGVDPSNPSHILHEGEALCGGVEVSKLCAPTKLGKVIREILLHPASTTETASRYCENCLTSFRSMYDFALEDDDLSCPECGSMRRSCTDLETGVYRCKACGWRI